MKNNFEAKLQQYFNHINLDIRKRYDESKGGGPVPRYMDQKCTPDVISTIAASIIDLNTNDYFTKKSIWLSPYFSNEARRKFSKPDSQDVTASREYDKFISQPLKMLAFAGILKEKQINRQNNYKILEPDLLTSISLSSDRSEEFLRVYLKNTLKQSGLWDSFQKYRDTYQSTEAFNTLKNQFISYTIKYSNIKNTKEITRIFPKVLNVLACDWEVPGSVGGRQSTHPITYAELFYNRENFRDVGKNKRSTRQTYKSQLENQETFKNSEMLRIMRMIRKRHSPTSEVLGHLSDGEATQVHHIFPKSTHPDLASIPENLILLTPSQHNTLAHPQNKTGTVSPRYQILCLKSKLNSVLLSEQNGDGFYSLENLIDVINIGFSLNTANEIPINSNFNQVKQKLRIIEKTVI